MLYEIIDAFANSNTEEQDAAAKRLRELSQRGLSIEDGITALKAAAKSFPSRRQDWQDSAADLARAAAISPHPEHISIVIEHFPLYSKEAKESALMLLAKLSEREAAVAYMSLLRTHARQGEISRLPMMPLQSEPRHAEVFFPEILEYSDIQGFEWDINLLLLNHLQAGLIEPETVASYGEEILERYLDHENKLMPMQRTEGIAWMWEDTYQNLRPAASLYLDLLGFFPTQRVKDTLYRALSYSDPRLRQLAVISLIRQGESIEQRLLFDIAASPEVRNHFYEELVKLSKSSLFPETFRTQAAFAESDMVHWLLFPSELGRVPDEIELMYIASFDTQTEDGSIDYYVFRFRTLEPDWAAKDGWMAGVSGPFLRKDVPSTRSYGETFSRFEAWDSKTPEEHLAEIRETLKNWREYHGRER